MAINLPYISAFLSKVEGPCQTTGYIPCHIKTGGTANYKGGPNPDRYEAMGASGVTIATGCDLGQTNEIILIGYGLDPNIALVFKPYYGKQRYEAINVLHRWPLVISRDAASKVDSAVHGGYLARYVIPAYEKDSGKSFASLPDQAQAAIMSVCFQKGVGGTRRDCPLLWSYLLQGNWKMASHELIYGFRKYKTRRKLEGELLQELC